MHQHFLVFWCQSPAKMHWSEWLCKTNLSPPAQWTLLHNYVTCYVICQYGSDLFTSEQTVRSAKKCIYGHDAEVMSKGTAYLVLKITTAIQGLKYVYIVIFNQSRKILSRNSHLTELRKSDFRCRSFDNCHSIDGHLTT